MKEKFCSSCKRKKPISNFQKNRGRPDGLQSHCRKCFKERWYRHDPQKRRIKHLLRYYGISWEQYLILYENQEGRCAICGNPLKKIGDKNIKSGAHVDHDHITGRIRGLLCHDCNAGLGYFKDRCSLLGKAISYLTNK